MNPKLSEDIRLAIGERSYGQVAVATGISKSTLSRMVNQTYKRAISPSLLWKLSATAQNNMTFELLMHDANFSDSEIAKYRIEYEVGNSNDTNAAGTFINNVIYSLLSSAADNLTAFTHETKLYDGTVGELKIVTGEKAAPSIYIIDGTDAASATANTDKVVCELLGRCVLSSAREKCKVSIVTPSNLLFAEISSVASSIANRVILVNSTGEAVIERNRI